jgi:pyruvate decarboxylase
LPGRAALPASPAARSSRALTTRRAPTFPGYAADGYARVKGLGCCVVTFTVGSLSAINAVAGAYAENLPIICVTGGPNTNDFDTTRIVHHSTGRRGDFMQELACFREVTCAQEVIRSLDEAHEQIDRALSAAVKHSKPAYICICCNLAALPHPSFAAAPLPYSISPRLSNPAALEAAADAAAQFLGAAAKPVLVAGALLRTAGAAREFMELVEASGYA